MFSRIIIKNVKNVLNNAGFEVNGEFMVLKVLDHVSFIRYYGDSKNYIIKYYDFNYSKVKNYLLLEKHGINMIKYSVQGNNLVMLEEIDEFSKYRFANEDDLKDERVIVGLAKWYKKLHSLDEAVVGNDYFTLDNLIKVINSFNLRNNECLLYIYNNFENIKLKFNRLNKCLVYGDFSLDNLVVSKDYKEVFMLNYDSLSRGYRYSDLRSIFSCIDDRNKEIFLREYGLVMDDEIVLDAIVSSVVKLYLATFEKVVPKYIVDVLENLNNGNLLAIAKSLVEWY